MPEVQRRFAGRPTNSPPGVVPGTGPGPHPPAGAGAARSLAWPLQALAGVLLVAFVGVHLVAQHLLAPGGLRDFTSVLAYLRQPVPMLSELGLVAVVAAQAALGARAVVIESSTIIAWSPRVTRALTALVVIVCAYVLWLTLTLVSWR